LENTILLDAYENTREIEEEEKYAFLRSILVSMELDIEAFWKQDHFKLDIEEKIKLRELLKAYSIQVYDYLDGEMQVYLEEELIGSWDKPTYILKKDLRKRDPKKQLYLEMKTHTWSIFQNEVHS
jgi:hypothetical protein